MFSYLGGKENWWIAYPGKQGSFTIPYYVLGQDWQIFISDQPPRWFSRYSPLKLPYQEHFERWKLNAEKALFYGSVNLKTV